MQPEIKSYADLRGKTVVVDAPNTAFGLLLYKVLKDNGLNKGDYAVKPSGGSPQRLEALLQDKANCGRGHQSAVHFNAAQAGLSDLGSAAKAIGAYQSDGAFVLRSWAKANSDTLVRYIQAYVEGRRWALDPANKAEAIRLLGDRLKLSPDIAALTYAVATDPVDGIAKDAKFDMEGFRNVLKLRAEIEGQWGGTPPAPDKYMICHLQQGDGGLVTGMIKNGFTRRSVLAGAAALGLPAGAITAAVAADSVDLAAARQEGKVSLYTSAPIAAAQKVATAFEQKFGIKVELFRSGGTEVLRRFMMERDAGHIGADVLVTSDPAAAIDLAAKGMFVPFRPAGIEQVPAGLNDPDGNFVAQRVSLIAIYARTDLIAPADLPKTWDDLIHPKYKGKLVMTDPSFTSLQVGVVAMMSTAARLGLLRAARKERRADRSGQRAGGQSGEDRRAADRGRRRRPICQSGEAGRPSDPEHLPGRRDICNSRRDRRGPGRGPPQCRQAAGGISSEPRGAAAVAAGRRLCGARRRRAADRQSRHRLRQGDPDGFPYIQRATPAVKKKFHEIFS